MQDIEKLASKYLLHSELYRAGLARISDKEFNQLEKQLKSVAPDHPVLNKIDEGLALKGIDTNSFDDWYKKIPDNETLIIQPKIDGIAILLRYVDGVLVAAFNRTGKDKTYHMRFIENVPQFIEDKGVIHIRGELYAPHETPATSQRIAAGHIRKKAPEKIDSQINFCAFEIVFVFLKQNVRGRKNDCRRKEKCDFAKTNKKLSVVFLRFFKHVLFLFFFLRFFVGFFEQNARNRKNVCRRK